MDFCAIISEFNPFHNGHDYIIKSAKKTLKMPIMCLMSGNFVQRGEPAIVDKYNRSLCAIVSGADMVVEIPTIYSLSSAENFAKGAIKTLKDLGCTHLAIGVTFDNLEVYEKLAKIKNGNLSASMQAELDKGQNYSSSLITVLTSKYPESKSIFTDASNILALEYIHQIKLQKANIKVVLLKRTDGGYNSQKPTKKYANATLIRKLAQENKLADCKNYMPEFAFQNFKPKNTSALENILLYCVRKKSTDELSRLYDYNEGLPYLISSAAKNNTTIVDAVSEACSKRYRQARIKKLFLYAALDITKEKYNKILKGKTCAKMLAINRDSKKYISQFNKNGIRVIVSKNDYGNLSAAQSISAQIDLDASNLYNLITKSKYNRDLTTGTIFCN